MANIPLKHRLKTCNENDFFDILEKCVEFCVPSQIRKVLTLNMCNSAIALSRGYPKLIDEIEDFMRNHFNKNMLKSSETMEDYLGLFVDNQKKFQLMSGQKRMLQVIYEYCRALYPPTYETETLESASVALKAPPQLVEPDLTYNYVPSLLKKHDRTAFRLIGSRMITCFNDAKRVTLSGWSWPSRQIAHEMAHSFEVSGDSTLNKSLEFDLHYLTPHNHAFFIDAIVQSDLVKVKSSLRQSLAVSLRIDGSVDRTGLHNIYVMAHILNRDKTTSTLFMGFGIPKTNGVYGYLQCLESVVEDILPWDEFFSLTTSIVTDGEPLNTGHLNGLCARLKEERLSSAFPELPLHSLWCVPHRINLAWKSMRGIAIINGTIQHCIKLSKYIRKSGVRNNNLKTAAKANKLNPPLRYPAFFKIRWTEYSYNLLNTVLRNYRASIKFFETQNLNTFLTVWLCYDRLHFIAFLADILCLLKKFQKSCQSDNISINDVLQLRGKFQESLESCKNGCLPDGWEKLFLQNVVDDGSEIRFHGIKLIKTDTFKFLPRHRHHVIFALKTHVNNRIDLDSSLHNAIEPLNKIRSDAGQHDLKTCHDFIIPDLDEATFLSEFELAAESLKNVGCDTPRANLRSLEDRLPESLHTIKIALARVIAIKPHSADVERLIGLYNKFKSIGRSSLSPESLWNYMYINVNMGTLENFDPTSAVDQWMSLRNRRPKSDDMSKQREWFYGVFDDSESGRKREIHPTIEF